MLRLAPPLCVALAVGLLILAVSSPGPAMPDPAFVVSPAESDLGTIPLGSRTVTISVMNPASRTRRIIGISESCQPQGACVRCRHPGQVTVAPGETFPYELELSTTRPGAFEAVLELFLEDNGIRAAPITIRGVAAATGKGT